MKKKKKKMEFQQYLNEEKHYYRNFIDFFESEKDLNLSFTDFEDMVNTKLNNLEQKEKQEEIKSILHLISKVFDNHHRDSNYFEKLEKIIIFLKDDIKQTLSNNEIFNLFKTNKLILLILFKHQIIQIDQSIVIYFYDYKNYSSFFIPEIKKFIKPTTTSDDTTLYSKLEEQRKIGENNSHICQLIRNDLAEEFIAFVNQTNLPLTSKIKPSFFETNLFLIDKEPTLIEYAAFFGSIQIIQYLKYNSVELSPSLWLYAIHSNNAELIHFLEENHVLPEDESYVECFIESVKCHHNEIANYIENNLLTQQKDSNSQKFKEKVTDAFYHYCNFSFISPENFELKSIIFYLSKYNYYNLVDLYIKSRMSYIQEKLIQKRIFNSNTSKVVLN